MAYVTLKEFKNAPTGIDTNSIIVGASEAQNDAELGNILERASAWVNGLVGQETLVATRDTDTREARFNHRDGSVMVVPDALPIVTLEALKYRTPGTAWTTADIANVDVYDSYFVMRWNSMAYMDPMAHSAQAKTPVTVEYTYVNGYATSTLTIAAGINDSTIALEDATGVYVGQRLTIYDDDRTEKVTVKAVAGNVIEVEKPLKYNHAAGVGVSALPASVKQATILLAAYLIKERGSLSVSMNETSLQGIGRYKDAADIDTAKELLAPYKRVL